MFKIALLSSIVIAALAAPAVQAAPAQPDIDEQRAIDRWVEILHPEELVGPPVDPSGPFRKADAVAFDPQPEPPALKKAIIAINN